RIGLVARRVSPTTRVTSPRAQGPPVLAHLGPVGHHDATTEEMLYQEWRRDRPVEATTTYRRRAGKVPSPGRCSCTIRELPSRPFRAGRVLSFPVPPPDPSAR